MSQDRPFPLQRLVCIVLFRKGEYVIYPDHRRIPDRQFLSPRRQPHFSTAPSTAWLGHTVEWGLEWAGEFLYFRKCLDQRAWITLVFLSNIVIIATDGTIILLRGQNFIEHLILSVPVTYVLCGTAPNVALGNGRCPTGVSKA